MAARGMAAVEIASPASAALVLMLRGIMVHGAGPGTTAIPVGVLCPGVVVTNAFSHYHPVCTTGCVLALKAVNYARTKQPRLLGAVFVLVAGDNQAMNIRRLLTATRPASPLSINTSAPGIGSSGTNTSVLIFILKSFLAIEAMVAVSLIAPRLLSSTTSSRVASVLYKTPAAFNAALTSYVRPGLQGVPASLPLARSSPPDALAPDNETGLASVTSSTSDTET